MGSSQVGIDIPFFKTKRNFLVGAVIASWAIIWGAYLIFWDLGYNSDVAMIGLMAKRVAVGAEFPVFVWTVGYNGILSEAYLAAGLFNVFGVSPLVLSLAAIFYASLFLWVFYLAIRRFFDSSTALLAVLLIIISCPQFYGQFLRTVPNYSTIHLGGVLGFLLLSVIVSKLTAPGPSGYLKPLFLVWVLGLIHGFLYYTLSLSLYFIVPVLGCIPLLLLGAHVSKDNKLMMTLLPYQYWQHPVPRVFFASFYLISCLSFLVYLPMFLNWIDLPSSMNRNQPFENLFIWPASLVILNLLGLLKSYIRKPMMPVLIVGYALGLGVGFLPALYFQYLGGVALRTATISGSFSDILFRLGVFWQSMGLFLNLTGNSILDSLIIVITAGSVVFFMAMVGRNLIKFITGGGEFNDKIVGQLLFLILPFVVMAAFLSSNLVSGIGHRRWLITFVILYSLTIAYSFNWVWKYSRVYWVRWVAVGLLGVCLLNNGRALKSYFQTQGSKARQLESIVAAFDEHQITRGYGYYWLAYTVDLLTNERLIIQPYDIPYNPNYAQYVVGQGRVGLINPRWASNNPKNGRITLGGTLYKVDHKKKIDNSDLVFYALSSVKSDVNNQEF